MTVEAPRRPPQPDELEALIREARARQRKRWLGAAGVVFVLAGVALSVNAITGGRSSRATTVRGPRPVASVPRCRSDQLRLSWRENGAYTGHFVTNFTFTNVAQQSCTLKGWPGIATVLRGGRRVSLETGRWRARNGGTRVQTVVLRPHGAASFDIVQVDLGMLSHPPCVPSPAWLVTPPGGTVPIRQAWTRNAEYCGVGIAVTPVVAGPLDHHMVR